MGWNFKNKDKFLYIAEYSFMGIRFLSHKQSCPTPCFPKPGVFLNTTRRLTLKSPCCYFLNCLNWRDQPIEVLKSERNFICISRPSSILTSSKTVSTIRFFNTNTWCCSSEVWGSAWINSTISDCNSATYFFICSPRLGLRLVWC